MVRPSRKRKCLRSTSDANRTLRSGLTVPIPPANKLPAAPAQLWLNLKKTGHGRRAALEALMYRIVSPYVSGTAGIKGLTRMTTNDIL